MPSETTALINDPMAVFAFLAMLVALIFWISEVERFKKTFELIPPVMYVYFVPMFATTVGITPQSSPLLATPEDTLQHRECSPQLWAADLHGEDAGADDPIADSNKYPGSGNIKLQLTLSAPSLPHSNKRRDLS